MHDPDDKNIKPIKCVACGSKTAVKKVTAHDKQYHAGLFSLFQIPIGIDHIISDYQYYYSRCEYK